MQRPSPETERPRCPRCGAELERADVILGLGQLAGRIFECRQCGYVEVVPVVRTPHGRQGKRPRDKLCVDCKGTGQQAEAKPAKPTLRIYARCNRCLGMGRIPVVSKGSGPVRPLKSG
jgi:hypothetical protein